MSESGAAGAVRKPLVPMHALASDRAARVVRCPATGLQSPTPYKEFPMARTGRRVALWMFAALLAVFGGRQLGFGAERSSPVVAFRFAVDTLLLKSFQWRSIGP